MPLQHYEILHKLGSGKYSSVYQVKRLSDNALFALKKVSLDKMTPKQTQNALNEAKLLHSIHHPNVISLVQVFFDPFIRALCLVMELAQEGDLHDAVAVRQNNHSFFSEQEVWSILQQLSAGLEFLHSHNVIHRDIKAKNILMFKKGTVKIGDMNVSTITQGLSYTRTGTLLYASPQILMGRPYNTKTDIWSLGCLIYELMCLRPPFQSRDVEDLYKKISRAQYPRIVQDYSRELQDLVSFMLQPNPKLRPSAQTIRKIIVRNKRLNKFEIRESSLKSFTPFTKLDSAELSIQGWTEDREPSTFKRNGEADADKKTWENVRRPKIKQLCPLPSTLKMLKNSKNALLTSVGKTVGKREASRQTNRLFSQPQAQGITTLGVTRQKIAVAYKQPCSATQHNQRRQTKRLSRLQGLILKRRNTQN